MLWLIKKVLKDNVEADLGYTGGDRNFFLSFFVFMCFKDISLSTIRFDPFLSRNVKSNMQKP